VIAPVVFVDEARRRDVRARRVAAQGEWIGHVGRTGRLPGPFRKSLRRGKFQTKNISWFSLRRLRLVVMIRSMKGMFAMSCRPWLASSLPSCLVRLTEGRMPEREPVSQPERAVTGANSGRGTGRLISTGRRPFDPLGLSWEFLVTKRGVGRARAFTPLVRSMCAVVVGLLAAAAMSAAPSIPESSLASGQGAGQAAFVWNRDAFWSQLEAQFLRAKSAGAGTLDAPINEALAGISRQLDLLAAAEFPANAPVFDTLEAGFFQLGPMVAASPDHLPDFVQAFSRMRSLVKQQSSHWPMEAR